MISITTYDGARDCDAWNDFAARCKNATFMHQRGYMDYHSNRFADHSLLAWNDGKLVAMLPANVDEATATLWSHQGLTYGGWLMPLKHFDVTTMLDVMDAACNYLRAEGLKRLVYKPVPHIYHAYPAEEDLYALFRHEARLIEVNASATIALATPLPPDRGNKHGINVARKAGVTVAQSHDLAAYWQLLAAVLEQRHGVKPVHTLEEMQLLASRFPSNIKLYTATLGGRILAGTLLYITPQVVHTQYIAASEEGRQLCALALLMSTLAQKAKQSGYAYLDFGISNEDHGRYLNAPLAQQKNRLGGRTTVYCAYEVPLQ